MTSKQHRLSEREIARRLTEAPRPVPPQDLLERLRAEIPQDLGEDREDVVHHEPVRVAWWSDPRLRIAATLFLLAGAGALTWQLARERAAAPISTFETSRVTPPESAARAEALGRVASDGQRELAAAQPPAEADVDPRSLDERQDRLASPPPVRHGETGDADSPAAVTPAAAVARDQANGATADHSDAAGRSDAGAREMLAKVDETASQRPERERFLSAMEARSRERADTSTAPTASSGAPEARKVVARDQLEEQSELLDELKREQSKLEEALALRGLETPSDDRGNGDPRASTAAAPPPASPAQGSAARVTVTSEAPIVDSRSTFAYRAAAPTTARLGTIDVVEPDATRPEPDAMFFDRVEPSAFVDTAVDAESTFGLDVDTGSYTLARSYFDRGLVPPPESVRVEEYLNAFDYGDRALRDRAPRNRDFALIVEGARAAVSGRHFARIAVAAREIDAAERQSASLTFLVDTSGSMQREDRLELVKRALVELLDELRAGDTVALVTYGTNARVVLAPTADREAVRQALSRLYPEGSTNLEDGMRLAYEMASRNASAGRIDRIILCSDGVANVGVTDPESLLRRVADWAASGIELTAVGFGMGNYNDALMERLADRGDGRYAYVDRLEEARRIFVENLTGTLQTVAADARVQVAFDSAAVVRYRLLGYENRTLPDQAFRDPRTDAGEIGAGHRVTALYELELAPGLDRRAQLGEVRLRYRPKSSDAFEELTTTVRAGDLDRGLDEAPASLRLAVVVARFAELLRGGRASRADFDLLLRDAQRLVPSYPGRTDVIELAGLIGKARDRTTR